MTQNKETYRFKGRAIFLAAIMVISVLAMPIAFAGGAAATAEDADLTFDDQDLSDGDVQVTGVTVSDDGDVGANTDGEGEASIVVTYDNEDGDVIIAGVADAENASNDDIDVDIASIEGFAFDANYEGDFTAHVFNDSTLEATGLGIGDEVSTAQAGAALDAETATITLDENAPGALAGTAFGVDRAHNVSDLDERAFWQGQEIAVFGLDAANEEVQLREKTGDESSSLRAELTSEELGDTGAFFVEFETEDRNVGEYFLRGSDAGVPADGINNNLFEVVEQDLDAEFDDSEVSDTGDDAKTEIEFNSNRGTYSLSVSADGDLDVDELTDIFTAGALTVVDDNEDDDDDTITLAAINDGDFDIDFDGIEAGDYDFDFEVVDSTAAASDSITVVEGQDGELNIDDVDVTQGDIAQFDVDLSNTDDGKLAIGNEDDDGYQANITISNADEDTVTVYFNTYTAGNASEFVDDPENIVFADSDEADVVLESQTDLTSILDTGDYEVTAAVAEDFGGQDGVLDDPDAVASLRINERTDLDATQWRAGADTISDLEDELNDEDEEAAIALIGEAVEGDLVTETDMFAVSETNTPSDAQIHQISADGLHGLLGSVSGDDLDDIDTTDAFLSALENENNVGTDNSLVLELEQQNPGSNQDPIEAPLTALDSDDITVIYDGEGDYYVVFNTDALTDAISDIEEDQEYEVTFAVQDDRLLDEDDEDDLEDLYEEISWEFDLDEAEGDFLGMNDDDEVEAEAAEDQEITVDTNVAPGTEIDIRTRNGEDTSPSFIKNERDVVVSADGEAVAVFDFSDQSAGDEFTVSVRSAAFELSEDGLIVDAVEEVDDDEMDDADDEADDEMDDHDDMDDQEVDDHDDEVDETEDDTPGFGALIALVAVLGAALLAVRRQN